MINRLRAWVRENPHCLALTYWIFYLTGFFLLERREGEYFLIQCPLDEKIPFLEIFVIPYASWFLLLAVSQFWTMIYSKEDFLDLCALMFAGNTICLLIYLFIPNGLDLRPETVPENFWGRMVGFLYSLDTSTNVCPSIHVSSSVAAALVAWRSKALADKRWIRRLVYLWVVLICLSTMFIKQHSIVDVACGLALSLALYPVACVWDWRGAVRRAVGAKVLDKNRRRV